MIRTTFPLPRSYPRAALVGIATLSLLVTACGGGSPQATAPARVTATPGGSAVAGGGRFIATLIPLTEPPSAGTAAAATRAPLGTPTRGANGSVTPRPGNVSGVPTGTAVSRGATVVGTAATGTRTWTDPGNNIRLEYPATWRATPAATPDDDDLRLDGPNNQTIFVDIFSPDVNGPAPTADEALQVVRDAQARSVQYTYTYGAVQDVMVGNEPAKYLEYQYTPKANRTATAAQGAIWAIQRGDHTYVLRASNISTGRADVDSIITSVSYPQAGAGPVGSTPSSSRPGATTPAATANTRTAPRASVTPMLSPTAPLVRGTASAAPMRTPPPAPTATPMVAAQQGPAAFMDPDGRMTFQFPQGWKFINPGGDAGGFFEFDGPDGALIFVNINDSAGTLDDAVRTYRDAQAKSTIYTSMDGDVMDAQVGGEPGKLVTYTYTSQARPSDPPRDGAVWIVIRNGKQFDFEARNIGTHRPEVDGMISSIHFMK